MDTKQLMINDWLFSKIENRPFQISTPTILYTLRQGYDDGDEPIPLTDEIYKLNGFWEEGGGYTKFDPEVGTFTTWKSKIENVQCVLVGSVETPLYYVHQLQQILRICGLTELANNFKVK